MSLKGAVNYRQLSAVPSAFPKVLRVKSAANQAVTSNQCQPKLGHLRSEGIKTGSPLAGNGGLIEC